MATRFDVLNDNEYAWKTVKSHTKNIQKHQDKKNVKQQLCKNMIETSTCCYGTKCLFAHKLSEQAMNQHRQYAYDIVLSDNDLSHIDMIRDPKIYKSLLTLTTMCEQCKVGKCTGGYNCKHGACKQSYVICQRDLDYGDCVIPGCSNIHLTKRNLRPFFSGGTYGRNSKNNSVATRGILLTEEFFNNMITNSSLTHNVKNNSAIGFSEENNSKNSSCNVSHEDSDVEDDCDKSIFE